MGNPIGAFDPDGKKVYLIVEKYRTDINEKGEMIQIPYKAVIDVTKITEEEISLFECFIEDWVEFFFRFNKSE